MGVRFAENNMQSAANDLRSYLEIIRKEPPDFFLEVGHEVGLNYEMTAIVNKLAIRNKEPVVFFKRVKGGDHAIVSNLFSNRKSIALALDCDPEELNDTYLERLRNPIDPRIVDAGPVMDVVQLGEEADLTSLPIPTH